MMQPAPSASHISIDTILSFATTPAIPPKSNVKQPSAVILPCALAYPGRITTDSDGNGDDNHAKRLIPSFITNVPAGLQREYIMRLLSQWMTGRDDEHHPILRESFSFLRILWYHGQRLPSSAKSGTLSVVPTLGTLTLTDEYIDDLHHYIRWIKVRYIWLSDLKDPIRFGAIGIPLMRNDLPPHL
jgi:hypothetical protein